MCDIDDATIGDRGANYLADNIKSMDQICLSMHRIIYSEWELLRGSQATSPIGLSWHTSCV
jgi:hypothetical protein